MRQEYTHRIVIAMTALLAVASTLFAVGAARRTGAPDRAGTFLDGKPDTGIGRELFVKGADPPCASCHTLRAADSFGQRASNLDDLRPSRRQIIVSIIGGTVGAHEDQNYGLELSDRQVADLASYVAEVAGKTP